MLARSLPAVKRDTIAMASNAESVFQSLDAGDAALELLMFGFSPEQAAQCMKGLRDTGQAVRLEHTDSRDGLVRLLETEPADLTVIHVEGDPAPAEAAIELVRESNPSAAILLVSPQPDALLPFAIRQEVQDLLPSGQAQRLVLALKREYRALLLRNELARTLRSYESERERFQSLLDTSLDAIAYLHEGMHMEANRAYRELFGLSESDLEGLSLLDLAPPESRTPLKRMLRQAVDRGEIRENIRCRRSDGLEFDVTMEFIAGEMGGERCVRILIRHQAADSAPLEKIKDQDPQTGLLNRHAFMRRLDESLDPANGEPPGLLLSISLDDLGEPGDILSMPQGDCMLKEVAGILEEALPEARLLARFGEHSFIGLLPAGTSVESPARRCIQALRRARPERRCGLAVAPRYSAGAISLSADERLSVHEWVRRCRHANRQAREEQRDLVVYRQPADSCTTAEPPSVRHIVELIDHALEQDRFLLEYQPTVSLDGDTRENYSVYVRLLGDDGCRHDPHEFLQQAQMTERMPEIDRWVIRQTIRALSKRRKRMNKVNFHVQLSREGALDDSMLLWICDCLREFDVRGKWLYFQLPYALLRERLPELDRLVRSLKKINCRISCHDVPLDAEACGTLQHYGVDTARFEAKAVKGLCGDTGLQERLAGVNSQIQEMGIRTVATAVEDADTLALLWNIGINHVQGYFLHSPSPEIEPCPQEPSHARHGAI